MKTRLTQCVAFILLALCLTNCKKKGLPELVNEVETFTNVKIVLVPEGGGDTVTLELEDLDANGPNAPVKSVSGPFTANTTYNASVSFLDETQRPVYNLTEEIIKERDEHQLFFQVNKDIATFTYEGTYGLDSNGYPFGLNFKMKTGAANTGNLTVTLIHKPVKDARGVRGGDLTNAGGETDFETFFPIVIR